MKDFMTNLNRLLPLLPFAALVALSMVHPAHAAAAKPSVCISSCFMQT